MGILQFYQPGKSSKRQFANMELYIGFLSSSTVRIPLRILFSFPLQWESLTLGEADDSYG